MAPAGRAPVKTPLSYGRLEALLKQARLGHRQVHSAIGQRGA